MDRNRRPLLNAKEAARLLGVTAFHIRSLARRKILPSVRVGVRAVRFDPDVLDRIIDGGGLPSVPRSRPEPELDRPDRESGRPMQDDLDACLESPLHT